MHTHGFFRAIAKPVWVHLRDYVRSPAYRSLHRFARRVRNVRAARCRVDFAGRPIELVDGPSFLSAWDEIFVNRIYDIGECRQPPVLIDAGANIGLAAIYWKWRYGDFRYVGFEPDADIAAVCRANLAAWNVAGQLHEVAVTGHDGTATFRPDGADAGRIVGENVPPGGRSVKCVDLAPYLTSEVDLLKIDIEGAEVDVLRAAVGRLSCVRNIFVETHSRPGEPQPLPTVLSILERVGFRCHLQIGYDAAQPFAERAASPAGFDSLVNVFGVRS
jgi:FkbM family methyltransferase